MHRLIPAEIIAKKRDGAALDSGEWEAFLHGFLRGEVAEYQVAALLMAVWFRGMTPQETRAVTRILMESGELWEWPPDGPVGDKHSTGGVGDKVSLVLAPVAAACGVRVPMVSGRGLAHTGGTLDKLESIPGFRTELARDDFERLLSRVGFAMGGQTGAFAPLDRELYALRDVTGTVESIPLIVSSIMSKKLAEGLDALVLDVKWGDGAFIPERERAEELARAMIAVGEEFGVRTEALLTDMGEPLGRTVGHALEVRESILAMRGEPADPRFAAVTVALTARLLVATGIDPNEESAARRAEAAIAGGDALERFRDCVEAQGGDPRVADDPDRLPAAPVRRTLETLTAGGLAALPARAVGQALVALGGGRRTKDATIDPAVGFELPLNVGDEAPPG
ncbi:MAG TPA: thymidine phosphorylase, partial [Gemmatimonadota bacterium]|nr:thymidine phosphorylase [Gemmatimonadota bacterium]